MEYDVQFESGDDAYDRLKEEYDKLKITCDKLHLRYGDLFVENKELRARYVSLYEMLLAHLEDEKSRKVYLVDKYQRENNEIGAKLTGLKQTKIRDLGLKEE